MNNSQMNNCITQATTTILMLFCYFFDQNKRLLNHNTDKKDNLFYINMDWYYVMKKAIKIS